MDITDNSPIAETLFNSGEDPPQYGLLAGTLRVTSTAIGSVAITWRWTDGGVARSFVASITLALAGAQSDFFKVITRDANSDLTYEVTLPGLGLGSPGYEIKTGYVNLSY